MREVVAKRCTQCQEMFPADGYWASKRSKDGLQSWCKSCSTARRIAYYQENKERENELRKLWNAGYRDWAISFKKDKPCGACKQVFHHAAMQWHHTTTNKVANVGTMVSKRMSKESVLAEIAKCELLCANCHAIKTWQREDEL